MTDAGAKRTLTISILVGLLIGGVIGVSEYGIVNPRAWSVAGLFVILVVAGVAGVIALRAFLEGRRAPKGPESS